VLAIKRKAYKNLLPVPSIVGFGLATHLLVQGAEADKLGLYFGGFALNFGHSGISHSKCLDLVFDTTVVTLFIDSFSGFLVRIHSSNTLPVTEISIVTSTGQHSIRAPRHRVKYDGKMNRI
jgi:hypothetical protein